MHRDFSFTLQRVTNNRLRLLTIVAAIFLPLTLIVSLEGMNARHMPEVGTPHVYFITLALMAGVTAILLLLFWRKGWFK
jgi:magnesium transporter